MGIACVGLENRSKRWDKRPVACARIAWNASDHFSSALIKIAAEEGSGRWNDRPQFQCFEHLTGGAYGGGRDRQSEPVFNNGDCAEGRHLHAG